MKRSMLLATILLALSAHAATISEARASLAQLRGAITNRDGVLLADLLGPNRFRSGGAIRWSDVEEYVTQAEAIVNSPVRTVSGETSVGQPQLAVIGWDGDVLYAARFLKDSRNRWLFATIHLGARARTAADRHAFAAYVTKVPEARLADGFFGGNRSTLGKLVDELEGLRDAASRPTPVPLPSDPLDDLVRRYQHAWFESDCAAISTLYDPRATLKDQIGTYDFAGIQRNCSLRSRRPECSVKLKSKEQTSTGLTATVNIWCPINATTGMGWNRTLQIATGNGVYRIVREEETP